MSRAITSLPALACFRVAAELESFSKAAERLNLTHGAVSRAVRLLEEDLGVALFERRNRAVFLTYEGRAFGRAVERGLHGIETAAERIRASREARPATVSCEPTLMMRWLIPRLEAFHAAHPGAEVHLVAGGGPVELGAGIDLAIRRDDFAWPRDWRADRLFDEEIAPVCRPDRAALWFANGALRPEAPRLHCRTRPDAWERWDRLGPGSAASSAPTGSERHFEHFYFSLQAASAGLGVAIGPRRLVADDLAAGLLVAPSGFRRDGSGYYLLARGDAPEAPSVVAFRGWLHEVAGTPLSETQPGPA